MFLHSLSHNNNVFHCSYFVQIRVERTDPGLPIANIRYGALMPTHIKCCHSIYNSTFHSGDLYVGRPFPPRPLPSVADKPLRTVPIIIVSCNDPTLNVLQF
jgi:hypothetical protein